MATTASETANADKLNTKIWELLADISTDEADWKAATEIREKDAAPLQSTCCSACFHKMGDGAASMMQLENRKKLFRASFYPTPRDLRGR